MECDDSARLINFDLHIYRVRERNGISDGRV
jgi:hypothetical protein